MSTAMLEPAMATNVSEVARLAVGGRVPDDTVVEIVDVVGGVPASTVDDIVNLHLGLFPDYAFVAAEIPGDAGAAPERDSLIVHQWLVTCDGVPAGLMLFDTNVARRVAVVHFLGIERPYRSVRIGGERLATWLCHRVRDVLSAELAVWEPLAVALGVFGESSDRLVRRWIGAGFRTVGLAYAEPVAGRSWGAANDRSMRPMNLLWLPMPGADDQSVVVGHAGAAAFLIDHYALPLDHPTVVATTGHQRTRRGARR